MPIKTKISTGEGPARCDLGFSLVELVVAMLVTLVILGAGVAVFTGSLNTRQFQSARTDALVSAQAAINVMSREIGNSGYGLKRGLYASNGLVLEDCDATHLHFRSNIKNDNATANELGEDITYYFDASTSSVVRYDPAASPTTSGIINQVSNVQFKYWDYNSAGVATEVTVPSAATARITIKLTVLLVSDVTDVENAKNVTVESDITLRNSSYGVGQY